MKQETLEEAADNSLYSTEYLNESERIIFKKGCVYGAKSDAAKDYWFEKFKQQDKNKYSEEDLREAFEQGEDNIDYSDTYGWTSKLTAQEWFEQFKK